MIPEREAEIRLLVREYTWVDYNALADALGEVLDEVDALRGRTAELDRVVGEQLEETRAHGRLLELHTEAIRQIRTLHEQLPGLPVAHPECVKAGLEYALTALGAKP